MRRVIARPAALVIPNDDGGDDVRVGVEAWITDEHGEGQTVELWGTYDYLLFDVDPAATTADYRGLLQTATPSGRSLVVRDVEAEDAVALPGLPAYPVPPVVIAATLSGENMDVHIEALTEDDGYVVTLLLVTDVGLYARFGGAWQRLVDVALVDGLSSEVVNDGAVDVFDAADRNGAQVTLSSLPGAPAASPGDVGTNVADDVTKTFTADAVTAAMAVIPVTIDTPRDIPAAIEAAATDPTLRWYVERRARAFDPNTTFPWEGESDAGSEGRTE